MEQKETPQILKKPNKRTSYEGASKKTPQILKKPNKRTSYEGASKKTPQILKKPNKRMYDFVRDAQDRLPQRWGICE